MKKIDDIIKITHSAVMSIISPGKTKKSLPKKESSRYPEIYLFRHGETYDNKNRIHSGWRDSKLTKKGRLQAKILARKLKRKKIDTCITSRLSRSIETAKIVFKGKKINYEIDNSIIERDYGEIAGKSKEKMMKEDLVNEVKYRRFYDFPPPGGESMEDVKRRVFPFCDSLVKRIRKSGENVAISCHGNSMKIIRLYFEKLPIAEVLIQENPLGQDYAQYVVTPKEVFVARQLKKKKEAYRS